MKKLAVIAPTILSVLAIVIVPKADAAPRVYRSGQGLGVSIDNCFVQFDPDGKLLQGGSMCDDIQLNEAKKAVQNYLREQNNSSSDAAPRVYQSGQGLGVSIGDCFVQFDPDGKLLQGGSMCDDIQLHEAKKAVQDYLRK